MIESVTPSCGGQCFRDCMPSCLLAGVCMDVNQEEISLLVYALLIMFWVGLN